MQCIKSLTQISNLKSQNQNLKLKTGYEVIVVDNGSTDGSVETVLESIKSITSTTSITSLRLIENKENLGFAKGNNIGIKQAGGEYIMLLNTDTVVKEGAIEKLVDFLDESSDKVAAVSPLVLNSDGTIQKDPCFLRFPSPLFVLFYYNSLLKKLALKFFPKLLFSFVDFSKPSFADQLPGAAIMIRKKVLDKIGLFDEDYQIYFEDADLCLRMKRAGYKLMLEPLAQIVHLGRQSIKSLIDKEGIEKFYLLNFQSLFRFCRKHYSKLEYLTVKAIILKQMLLTRKLKLFKKLMFS